MVTLWFVFSEVLGPFSDTMAYYMYGLIFHILEAKNKSLIFSSIFITVSETYLTPDGKKNLKIQNANKIILQMS